MTPAQALAMLPPDTGEQTTGGLPGRAPAEQGTLADLRQLASMPRI